MKYFSPIKVISPTDYVSNVKVLYDGGDDSVSVASLEWEGNPCIAMRWNIARREWDDLEKIKKHVLECRHLMAILFGLSFLKNYLIHRVI